MPTIEAQFKLPPAQTSENLLRPVLARDKKPLPRRRPPPGFHAPVKPRLLDIRPTHLRTKRIAVPTLIAEIRVRRDLHLLDDVEPLALPRAHIPRAVHDDIPIFKAHRRARVIEVRIVR